MSDLPSAVVDQINAELPGRADKIIKCLQTAKTSIGLVTQDGQGLRLAESAAYNLREALDAVVTGNPASGSHLSTIVNAWKALEAEIASTGRLNADSSSVLERELRRAAESEPIAEYSGLRRDANDALHRELTFDEVVGSYDRTVAWFHRMFVPPDFVGNTVIAGRTRSIAPLACTSATTAAFRMCAKRCHHQRSVRSTSS